MPFAFTPDIAIWPIMKQTTPYIFSSLILVGNLDFKRKKCVYLKCLGVAVTCTSILYAKQDTNYLVKRMALTLFIIIGYFVMWKRFLWEYFSVWRGITMFFVLNVTWCAPRVFFHHLN